MRPDFPFFQEAGSIVKGFIKRRWKENWGKVRFAK
jgi:hypothetical protein